MQKVKEKAPEIAIDCWVQGQPSTLEQNRGNVILIEVFQVNCPGCFIHGFPEVIEVVQRFQGEPLVTWGLATAFEDFDKNNLQNLQKLLSTGEVTGDTLAAMTQANLLDFNRLQYPIPFPIAWDKLVKCPNVVNEEDVQKIIRRDINNFDSLAKKTQEMITNQVKAYLKQKMYTAQTFEAYGLRGTPSSILIDKKGNVRYKLFGSGQGLEEVLELLLNE